MKFMKISYSSEIASIHDVRMAMNSFPEKEIEVSEWPLPFIRPRIRLISLRKSASQSQGSDCHYESSTWCRSEEGPIFESLSKY